MLKVHAPDPYRPQVRSLRAPEGHSLPSRPTRQLWETADGDEGDIHVIKPEDPEAFGIDPLAYL